jgi:hypothetical protein
MAGMDNLLNAIPLPLWATEFGALALVVLALGLLFWLVPLRPLVGVLPQIALLTVIAGGAYYGLRYFEDANRLAERRGLEDRASALFTQTIQPGSVFACIDGSPAPAMFEACERTLFAEPQRVAAAVAIVTQRLAYVADALRYASSRDADYLERIESLRKAIEADPYGFVAHVLSTEDGCTPDACARFKLLRDPARVKENLRVRRFEAFMVKYAVAWRGPAKEPAAGIRAPALMGDNGVVPGVAIGQSMTGKSSVFEPVGVSSAPSRMPPAAAVPASGAAPASSPAHPATTGSTTPQQRPPARVAAPTAPTRQKEPVAGLPRLVPRDYIREEPETEPASTVPQPETPTSFGQPR